MSNTLKELTDHQKEFIGNSLRIRKQAYTDFKKANNKSLKENHQNDELVVVVEQRKSWYFRMDSIAKSNLEQYPTTEYNYDWLNSKMPLHITIT